MLPDAYSSSKKTGNANSTLNIDKFKIHYIRFVIITSKYYLSQINENMRRNPTITATQVKRWDQQMRVMQIWNVLLIRAAICSSIGMELEKDFGLVKIQQ